MAVVRLFMDLAEIEKLLSGARLGVMLPEIQAGYEVGDAALLMEASPPGTEGPLVMEGRPGATFMVTDVLHLRTTLLDEDPKSEAYVASVLGGMDMVAFRVQWAKNNPYAPWSQGRSAGVLILTPAAFTGPRSAWVPPGLQLLEPPPDRVDRAEWAIVSRHASGWVLPAEGGEPMKVVLE